MSCQGARPADQVSVHAAGCVICWNIYNGRRESRFMGAHGTSRLTDIAFDINERRMLSAGNDGQVKLWNFNNGSVLKRYQHSRPPKEITNLAYVLDNKRNQEVVYATGWNRCIFVWEDADKVSAWDRRECVQACTAFPAGFWPRACLLHGCSAAGADELQGAILRLQAEKLKT